jgi:DNA-binding GntR family transcriptional regulator
LHETIVAAADNTVLLETYRSLHVHVLLARFFRERGEVGAVESNAEHQAIYTALAEHDEGAAVSAMSDHLNRAYLRAVMQKKA